MVTSFYNMVSRTLNALQVDIDTPAQKDYDELGVTLCDYGSVGVVRISWSARNTAVTLGDYAPPI